MPAHLLLGKLAGLAPAYAVAALDRLVPPMQKTLTAKLKADAVKQEVGRCQLRVCVSTDEHLPGFVQPWVQQRHMLQGRTTNGHVPL
jgi:TATA-binding protein interacting (TIP20)